MTRDPRSAYGRAVEEWRTRRERDGYPTGGEALLLHEQLVTIFLRASYADVDLGDILTSSLEDAARQLGHVMELVRGRPGSWESASIINLVKATVGPEDAIVADLPEMF